MDIMMLVLFVLLLVVTVAWIVMPFTVDRISRQIKQIEAQAQKRHEELIETIRNIASE